MGPYPLREAEGRDRVMELRSPVHEGRDLSDALVQVGEELAEDIPMSFRLVVEGVPRGLDADVHCELFLLCREALLNAFQHAGGTAAWGDERACPTARTGSCRARR